MSKEMKLIPQIRFPEFNEDWDLEELEQCLDYLQPTPYLVEGTDYKDEYETPVLTAGKSFVLGYTDEKEGIFKDNLPVIIFDDFTTASKFVDFPFKTKSSAMKILLAKNGYNIKFVYESMQTIDYEVGVHKRHWISVFSKLKIAVPQPQEQQKIASCLSSLDALIAAHNDKLESLKDHKKGLMQNLFPPEGQNVPNYRFAEFADDGTWIDCNLEDVTDRIGDGIHTTPKYDESCEYYFINGNNLIDGKIYVDEKTKKLTKSEFKKHQKDLNENTILLSINGTIGNVAFYNNEKVVLGKSACYINPKEELNNVFLFYLLQSTKISNYFFSELTGSTIKNLSLKSIREANINLPANNEQQKVASCLSALDSLLTAQTENIEQLQQHKKGLMQGLFPKINK